MVVEAEGVEHWYAELLGSSVRDASLPVPAVPRPPVAPAAGAGWPLLRHDRAMTSPQPGWYADPAAAAELRWWDGVRWTDDVVCKGVQAISALPPAPRGQGSGGQGAPGGRATGGPGASARDGVPSDALFRERVLVVGRQAGVVSPAGEHTVADAQGRPIGSVVEVGRSAVQNAARSVPVLDRLLRRRLEVRDAAGVAQLVLVRPATIGQLRLIVQRPGGGGEIGQLVQEAGGTTRWTLTSGGRPIGTLQADSGGAGDVALLDEAGVEVARTRAAAGGVASAPLAPDDARVVTVHRTLHDPLLSLVLAGSLTVDPVLQQDSRGPG